MSCYGSCAGLLRKRRNRKVSFVHRLDGKSPSEDVPNKELDTEWACEVSRKCDKAAKRADASLEPLINRLNDQLTDLSKGCPH